MNRSLRAYALFFGGVGLIVALDQWTKWLVRTHLPYNGTWLPSGWDGLGAYARILHRTNTGAAFSIFQDGNLLLAAAAVVAVIVILIYFPRISEEDWILRLAMTFYLAGVFGNLIDRLIRGEVTDFISVGTFAVFNVADASINVGVAIMILGVWIKGRAAKGQLPDASVSV